MRHTAPALIAIAPAVLVLSLTGALDPFQRTLDDTRFRLTERDPTGSIVLVDIDARSIVAEGRWPWPRRIHATLVDRLAAVGAAEIAFDVDFSSPSDPENDAAFAAALERAGGGVVLAALSQPATAKSDEKTILHNKPISILANHAWMAGVDVVPDSDGQVRRLSFANEDGGALLPSLAAILAGGSGVLDGDFRIDFGIRSDRFDRVSVSDVLAGTIDPRRLAGKKALIGATASELRDVFMVPVRGAISGSTLQALAAESILQDRLIRPTGPLISFIGILLATIFAALVVGRLRWYQALAALLGLSLAIELATALVQKFVPVSVTTAPVQVAILCFAIFTLLREIGFRRILLHIARNETNNAQSILDRVIADNFDGVIVVDEGGTIRAASRAAAETLGAARHIVGKPASDILPLDLARAVRRSIHGSRLGIAADSERHEATHIRPNGAPVVLEYTVTPTPLSGGMDHDGRPLPGTFFATLTFSDVTEERRAADKIAYLSEYDSLTGLPNRNHIVQRLARLLQEARRARHTVAVVCFDLDRFKTVNDTLGHDGGDQLLQALAERARIVLAPGDHLGRFGGDEFVAVCADGNAPERARHFAERMIARANVPYTIKAEPVIAPVSLGIAVVAAHESDPLIVLKQADTALHAAKAAGGNRCAEFAPGMTEDLQERRLLEFELWEAAMKRSFQILYQPQVDLAQGRVTGVEALLRWESARFGSISPAEFIPIAERLGLIPTVGQWVLDQACMAAASWPDDVRVAVNVSSLQFASDNFAEWVSRTLARAGLPASRLEIEITETLFMQENKAVSATLARLREMGVAIAIDDFGTGYSALQYLQRFKVDKIKIDRSFVAAMLHNEESRAIVRAIADLAEGLGVRLNAEGIETEEQRAMLRAFGCQEGQGYLFGKAASADEIMRRLGAAHPGRAIARAS